MAKKKEVKVEKVEVLQDKSVVDNVTHHLDRRDSGTNWNVADKLPKLKQPKE